MAPLLFCGGESRWARSGMKFNLLMEDAGKVRGIEFGAFRDKRFSCSLGFCVASGERP